MWWREWVLEKNGLGGFVVASPTLLLQFLSMVLHLSSVKLLEDFIGGPINPLLFLLIMEVFTTMIGASSTARLIFEFSVEVRMLLLWTSNIFFLQMTLLFFAIVIVNKLSTFVASYLVWSDIRSYSQLGQELYYGSGTGGEHSVSCWYFRMQHWFFSN